MKKRGQVTLFVIIGLILLIAIGILVYINNQEKIEKIPTETEFIQSYGAKLEPIANDVKFCLETIGKEAFEKIGLQGGYLDVTNYRHNSYLEHQNTALEIFQGSGLIIPYWAHIEGGPDCTSCVYKINVPNLEGSADNSVQGQVEKYLDEKIKGCTENFSSYGPQFEIKAGSPKSKVFIREQDVFIGLKWPINVTFPDDTESSLENFNVELDLRFKEMFELATATLFQMEMFKSERKLELFTLDIVDYLSLGGKKAAIPPREGPIVTDIEAPGMWRLENVKDTLKQEISENIQFVQVFRSRDSFFPFTEDPYQQNIYSNFQNEIYTDDDYLMRTKIGFNYFPDWPFYLRISPSAGPIILPESTFQSMIFFQLAFTRYKFSYDITYPVLVTFEDDVSYGGEGYNFQFAYEQNLRNSKPYSNETIFLNISEEDLNTDLSGFGKYDQRTIPVKINVVNGYTLEPLEDITLIYECGDKSLLVGTSEIIDGSSIIDTMMPPCLGGYFNIFGKDYSGKRVFMDMILGRPRELLYEVYPEKEFTIELKKRLFSPTVSEAEFELKALMEHDIAMDRKWQLIDSPNAIYSMLDDEEAMIILTEIIDGQETEQVKFSTVNFNQYDATIKLTPGLYKLQIISILSMGENKSRFNLLLPKKEYEVPDDFWSSIGIGAGETITIPEITINDSMLVGSINFDASNGFVNLSVDNLLQTNKVTFFYAGYELDEVKYPQDLSVLEKLNSAAGTNRDSFLPKFSKE